MLGKYKKRIIHLTELLRLLEHESENLDVLIALQGELVLLIKKAEANISQLRELSRKSNLELKSGRGDKTKSTLLRKHIETYKTRITEYQYLIFLWKSFGDGIAYIYLDKFALKHTYYNTKDYMPKQDAGALSGKAGLKQEWAIIKALRKKEFPAMLCDITNTIRHGDVCVLIGPDPILMEVKTSRNVNSRVERQKLKASNP